MKQPILWMSAVGALALLWAGAATPQERPREIIVTGAGTVSVKPDVARIYLGVQAEEETAKAALEAMSLSLSEVFAELDAAGIEEKDRQTTGLNLDPIYSREEYEDRMRREITGYRASSMLSIRVAEIDNAGALIDALTRAGVNRIDQISFEVSDAAASESEARLRAVEDAAGKAREFADAAGVALGEVVSITESGSSAPRPMVASARMASEASFAVPVAEGSISVEAQITMVYRIGEAE